MDATGMHAARWHLSEYDLLVLFRTYPSLAASFLERLPLHQTGMVKTTSRCDLSDSPNATLIEDDASMISAGTDGSGVQTTAAVQFWENVILRGKESQGNPVFVTSHMVPVTATTEPVAHFSTDDQQQAGSSGVSDIPQTDDQHRSEKVQLGIEYEKLLLEQPGDSPVETSCHSPPFSQLLKEAVEHVDRTRQPLVFEGPTLQIIVQHKWESSCRAIFMLMFQAYAVFLGAFALTTLFFDTLLDADSDVEHSAAWSMWGLCCVYSILLLKREFHQVREALLDYVLITRRCTLFV